MTPTERFWSLIHELAEVLDENVLDRQITPGFATDLHSLPTSVQQNCQRDLHVVSFALTHLSEHLLPSQSPDTRPEPMNATANAGSESVSANAQQLEASMETLDNEGSPIPGVTPVH